MNISSLKLYTVLHENVTEQDCRGEKSSPINHTKTGSKIISVCYKNTGMKTFSLSDNHVNTRNARVIFTSDTQDVTWHCPLIQNSRPNHDNSIPPTNEKGRNNINHLLQELRKPLCPQTSHHTAVEPFRHVGPSKADNRRLSQIRDRHLPTIHMPTNIRQISRKRTYVRDFCEHFQMNKSAHYRSG